MNIEEDITDFANALEAAAVNLKQRIAQRHDVTHEEKQLPYDLMKVVTRQTQGSRGYYLKASPEDNKNNQNFELLIEDLKQHNGKLTKQGYFCWLFDDNTTAGMKQSKK